ncbi:lactate/malate family dehydrogenase, partial [Herbidospora sp. RD11066]
SAGNFKVCVCGGAGGIGQPLSMLMALDPTVKELCVFDLTVAAVPAAGVAADLGHLERKSEVKGCVLDVDAKPVENH